MIQNSKFSKKIMIFRNSKSGLKILSPDANRKLFDNFFFKTLIFDFFSKVDL